MHCANIDAWDRRDWHKGAALALLAHLGSTESMAADGFKPDRPPASGRLPAGCSRRHARLQMQAYPFPRLASAAHSQVGRSVPAAGRRT
jgi:hypothetical protein